MQQTEYIDGLHTKQFQEFFKEVDEKTLNKVMDNRLAELVKEKHKFVRRIKLTESQFNKAVGR